MKRQKHSDSLENFNHLKNISNYESIRLNPDKSIGRNERNEYELHGFNIEHGKVEKSKFHITDILYNIFDEIATNALDHAIKTRLSNHFNIVKNIAISFDEDSITVTNDGPGFDIDRFVTEKSSGKTFYGPEAAFTLLNTSSNYDKSETLYSGGKNGHGAKLTFIYSKKLIIDTTSITYNAENIPTEVVRYQQNLVFDSRTFKPNSELPNITRTPFVGPIRTGTLIRFFPDPDALDGCVVKDIEPLIIRRAMEMTQFFEPGAINISLNGSPIHNSPLPEYTKKFVVPKVSSTRTPVLCHVCGPIMPDVFQWKFSLYVSPNGHKQDIVSYVNGMYTPQGGSHVNHVLNIVSGLIYDRLSDKYKESEKKKKSSDNVGVTKSVIKGMISGMIIAFIDKPQFESQIKAKVSVPQKRIPPITGISNEAIKHFLNRGLIKKIEDRIELLTRSRLTKEMNELKCKGRRIKVDKYRPAGFALSRSHDQKMKATLIISEGDSANGQVIKGLKVLGQKGADIFGTFPVRGKVINAMKQKEQKVHNNVIFKSIVTILGLEFKKDYTHTKRGLNYGRVLIFTDADEDGTHIKGLIISIFQEEWPSLLKSDDFIYALKTPYVRVKKGDTTRHEFYSLRQYKSYVDVNGPFNSSLQSWYYKGIGSNTDDEIADIFERLTDHFVVFRWDLESSDWINVAFGTSPQARREWLKGYDPNADDGASYEASEITYSTFINEHMKNFACYDNWRKIPSLLDGLKPVQRKIIYGMKKLNSKKKSKMNILCAKLMAISHYAHGEGSIQQAAFRMGQCITGINNLNLLKPEGNFGSREEHKCAQPRYAYTKLEPWTQLIFRPEDDPILIPTIQEGKVVEPLTYAPIIPMILVNGTDGIGTAHSTFIPKYKLGALINIILARLDMDMRRYKLSPYYVYFKGTIEDKYDPYENVNGYICKGVIQQDRADSRKFHITEIPVGGKAAKTHEKYKEFLGTLIDKGTIVYARAMPQEKGSPSLKKKTRGKVSPYMDQFTIILSEETALKMIMLSDDTERVKFIYDTFKLRASISINNMKLFDKDNVIKKFVDPIDIFDEYFDYRLEMYAKRKQYILQELEREINLLHYKRLFIKGVIITRDIETRDVKRMDLIRTIDTKLSGVRSILKVDEMDDQGEPNGKAYKVLRNMKVDDLTTEAYQELARRIKNKEDEIEKVRDKKLDEMWKSELKELISVLPPELL